MAKELTTNLAFARLIESPYYWSLTGLDKGLRRYYRCQLRSGKKKISIEKKEELLEKAGFSVRQEKTWDWPE
ncbi:hypothetical protein [Arsenicibacter rosenii]|uniref:Uncharacterized protein n=1 Tax=Arsenicibacter rosenii TaxID=1750698 RepID=A0A1S2VN35_9BACT|nr:hypothetical protein [Arsenicibacter rosenii]OIN59810.1 hypothetical protein BLX24_08100 [Arsenicibacter rosenii]